MFWCLAQANIITKTTQRLKTSNKSKIDLSVQVEGKVQQNASILYLAQS